MGERDWWKKITVYQIYPKSFKDTNDDGIGDLKGIVEKLDYLQNLGIEAIWINPVYRSPMVDNGYDIMDYKAINPQFGTMQDMDQLIGEAGKRGIRIIMDLVLNHTSNQHPWFLESKSSRTNAKKDWYIWRDPKPDGTAPTNWRAEFGGSSWTFDQQRGQYYLHCFAAEQPDLNWANPDVRAAIYELITFWLEKGVGGFRLDAITYIKKPERFTDLEPNGEDGLAPVGRASLNQPGILDYLRELKARTFARYDIFTVAEAPGVPAEQIPQFTGENGVFSMLIEFDHINMGVGSEQKWYEPVPWSLTDLKRIISKSQHYVNKTGWSALYLENHDSPRSINSYLGDQAVKAGTMPAKLLATFYMLLKGTPYIYQGQELGMTNVHYPSIDEYDDLSSFNQYRSAIREGHSEQEALEAVWRFSRDNSRTPMQWNDQKYAGFSTQKPWLGVHPNFVRVNAQAKLRNPDSLYYYYQKLIRLRKSSRALLYGDYALLEAEHEHVWAYTRSCSHEKMLVILNFSNTLVDFPSSQELVQAATKLVLGNVPERLPDLENKMQLKPYEARVYLVK